MVAKLAKNRTSTEGRVRSFGFGTLWLYKRHMHDHIERSMADRRDMCSGIRFDVLQRCSVHRLYISENAREDTQTERSVHRFKKNNNIQQLYLCCLPVNLQHQRY